MPMEFLDMANCSITYTDDGPVLDVDGRHYGPFPTPRDAYIVYVLIKKMLEEDSHFPMEDVEASLIDMGGKCDD